MGEFGAPSDWVLDAVIVDVQQRRKGHGCAVFVAAQWLALNQSWGRENHGNGWRNAVDPRLAATRINLLEGWRPGLTWSSDSSVFRLGEAQSRPQFAASVISLFFTS